MNKSSNELVPAKKASSQVIKTRKEESHVLNAFRSYNKNIGGNVKNVSINVYMRGK